MITTKNEAIRQVGFIVSTRIRSQICNEVECQILDQVSFSVNHQINKRVDDRIYNITGMQVCYQIRDHLRWILHE